MIMETKSRNTSKINGMSIADNFWCTALSMIHITSAGEKNSTLDERVCCWLCFLCVCVLFCLVHSLDAFGYFFLHQSTRSIENLCAAIVYFAMQKKTNVVVRLVINAIPTQTPTTKQQTWNYWNGSGFSPGFSLCLPLTPSLSPSISSPDSRVQSLFFPPFNSYKLKSRFGCFNSILWTLMERKFICTQMQR